MALTQKSMTTAARRRVNLAQELVHDAQSELDAANKDLQESIPTGDMAQIRNAHAITQQAEKTVADAAAELDVAAELLADEPVAPSAADASGSGMRSLVESLRAARSTK